MAQDLKAAKKPYSAPAFHILDANSAQQELETIGASHDANAREMLSAINRQMDREMEGKAPTVRAALAKAAAQGRS